MDFDFSKAQDDPESQSAKQAQEEGLLISSSAQKLSDEQLTEEGDDFVKRVLETETEPVKSDTLREHIRTGSRPEKTEVEVASEIIKQADANLVEKEPEPKPDTAVRSSSAAGGVFFTAAELSRLEDTANRYLLEPLLPTVGTAILAGMPDTGKSQFARQLSIVISQGREEFLGFKLNTPHRRVIYVATEDDKLNIKFLSNQQHNGLGLVAEDNHNLEFFIAGAFSSEAIVKILKKRLTEKPADLVVIDGLGDVFQGEDSNSNMQCRRTINEFDQIAKGHNCLLLFLHHLNKAGYGQAPNQQHVQGGSGLVQKVRSVLQLSSGEGNTKRLSMIKGNYTPQNYKKNSIELEFDPENFIFSKTGNEMRNEDLGGEYQSKEDTKYTELLRRAKGIFSENQQLKFGEFCASHGKYTNKGIATAKRDNKAMLDMGIIVKADDDMHYQLAPHTSLLATPPSA